MIRPVADVLVAATTAEATQLKRDHPNLNGYLVLTPRSLSRLRGCVVGSYTWTDEAKKLPARQRMNLRTVLAPCLADDATEVGLETLLQPAPLLW